MNVNFNSGQLFGMNKSSSGTSGLYGMIGEYNNIRLGAYFKVLKEYYGTGKTSSTSSSNGSDKSSNKIQELLTGLDNSSSASKVYTKVKTEAADLKKAAEALTTTDSKSLFEEKEKTVKDEQTGEETTVKEVDRKAVEDAVKNFVSAYNDTLGAAYDSKDTDVIRNAGYMTDQSKIFGRALEEVGITVNKDNTLSVDSEKLGGARLDNLKTLFNGSSSYARFVSQRADMVNNVATQAATKANNLYNSNGGYSAYNAYSGMEWYL